MSGFIVPCRCDPKAAIRPKAALRLYAYASDPLNTQAEEGALVAHLGTNVAGCVAAFGVQSSRCSISRPTVVCRSGTVQRNI